MNNQKKVRYTIAATSLFALFLNYVGVGLVFPLFPQMCYDTNIALLSPAASSMERSVVLGVLLAIMPLTQFFFAPLLGSLSDEQGRRPLLIKSLFIGFLGYCIGAYAVAHSSLVMLFLSRIVVGISTSNSSVVAASLADISSKEERASYFSLYGTGTGAGMAVGPLLGALLSNKSLCPWASYSLPFLAAGLMTLLNLLAVLMYFPKETSLCRKAPSIKPVACYKLILDSFFEKKVRLFFLIAFLFYYGWTFFWEFVPVTVMHTIGYPSQNIGYIYMTGAISYVILSLFITRKLITKIAISVLLPLSIGFLALCIGITGEISSTPQLLYLVIVQQFFLSCIYPLFSTYISMNSSEESQGRSLGMLNAVKAMACSLGPLCSGLFFSLSSLVPIIIGVATLSLSSLFAFRFFATQKKAIEVEEDFQSFESN
jgi:DHA1 family tetracycline resistance protein-like MFS transporter